MLATANPTIQQYGNIPKSTIVLKDIMKFPDFPSSRIDGAYEGKSDEEVAKLYKNFASTWKEEKLKVRRGDTTGTPKGLSIDKFVQMVADFYGDAQIINRDTVNRVIHTGDPNTKIGATKINHEVLRIFANFSDKYSYKDLVGLAQEALSGESPKSITPSVPNSNVVHISGGDMPSFGNQNNELDDSEPDHNPIFEPLVQIQEEIRYTESKQAESKPNIVSEIKHKKHINPFSLLVFQYVQVNGANGTEKVLQVIRHSDPFLSDEDAERVLLDIFIGKSPPVKAFLALGELLGLDQSRLFSMIKND